MRIESILLQKVKRLGGVGTFCSVKRGYANFLFRQKMALRATKKNRELFEKEKETYLKLSNDALEKARLLEKKIDGVKLRIVQSAGSTGQLYGSIAARDLLPLLAEKGLTELKPSMVLLKKPIKTTGSFFFVLQLHPEIDKSVQILVGRTNEELESLEKEDQKSALTLEKGQKSLSDVDEGSQEKNQNLPAEKKPEAEVTEKV